ERRVAWTTCCQTMVLPIPGSPVMASAAGAAEVAARKARISAISPSRPTGPESISPLELGVTHPGTAENQLQVKNARVASRNLTDLGDSRTPGRRYRRQGKRG